MNLHMWGRKRRRDRQEPPAVLARTFVGRERELGRLLELLAVAARGSPAACSIEGEPGMGKEALLEALRRALALYPDRKKWQRLQAAGMEQDHSWDRSAREYVKIYERALRPRTARHRL